MNHETITVAVTPQEASPDSCVRTMVNLFVTPARAFSALALTRRWLIPLILCSLCAVGYEITTSRYRMADVKDRISHDTSLSQEEVSRRTANIDAQRTTGISIRQLALGTGILTIGHVVKVLALAAIMWLVVLMFRKEAMYAKLFSGVSFIFLVLLPEQALKSLLINIKGSYQVYFSPAILLPIESRGSELFQALERLDIFSFWMAALMAIALPILTGMSKRAAVITVASLWTLWVLLGLLPWRLLQIN